ncbi:hypothetical protein BKA67DRAFT_677468 [Truncatella angustata]|uniref:Uncharacterized protein n=1 Tax=Truncatella angustata TaxID=152316 RepID=A0A9P8UMD0_9PEZI|nr:uncharacterized protein BKA67DRAFT_677468 [Truncatella angustata]KAH6654912.1 hypothetical protein BKA67DRAFT_677468 [Truncatella angustata]
MFVRASGISHGGWVVMGPKLDGCPKTMQLERLGPECLSIVAVQDKITTGFYMLLSSIFLERGVVKQTAATRKCCTSGHRSYTGCLRGHGPRAKFYVYRGFERFKDEELPGINQWWWTIWRDLSHRARRLSVNCMGPHRYLIWWGFTLKRVLTDASDVLRQVSHHMRTPMIVESVRTNDSMAGHFQPPEIQLPDVPIIIV